MNTKTHKRALLGLFGAIVGLVATGADSYGGQGPQPNICVRSCWGARNTSCTGNISVLNRAIIHHTAGNEYNSTGYESSKSYMRAVQNLHIDGRGWCDIGYHFLVDKYGNVFEGRKNSMTGLPVGAHDGNNGNSFGFTCLGWFHPDRPGGANQPTTPLMNALYDVIAWRMPSAWSPYGAGTYNGNSVGYLDGHRKVKATACPGDLIYGPYITDNRAGGPARDAINQRKNGIVPPPPPPAFPNQAQAVGDFDGDGKSDIAWRKVNWGSWVVYYGSGVVGYLIDNDATFDTRGNQAFFSGDFNGDGKSDIAWRKTGWGVWRINYGGNTTGTIGEGASDFSHGGQRYAVGDFDNDNKTDLAYRKSGWPEWRVTFGSGGTGTLRDNRTDFDGSSSGQVHFVGDFDGDGREDITIRKTGWGHWVIAYGNGTTGAIGENGTDFVADGQRHAVGDFNGDGKTDLAYRKSGWAEWRVTFGGGATGTFLDNNGQFDGTGVNQIQFVVDINGDGRKDIVWRKTGWGVWTINYGTGGAGQWGEGASDFNVSGQIHLAQDFNGDGKTDLAYRKTGWTEWRVTWGDVAYSTMGDGAADFDVATSLVMTGDFNGDLKSDIVYRKNAWPEWRATFGGGGTGTFWDSRTDFDRSYIVQAGLGGNLDYIQYAHKP